MKIYLLALILMAGASARADETIPKNEDKPAYVKETKVVDGEKITVLKKSYPWTKTVKAPVVKDDVQTCDVDISTDYWQEDKFVKVGAVIEKAECDVSSGAYTVMVRTENAAGEKSTHKYLERWSRTENEPFETIHKYSMNGDVDLVRVRVKLPLTGSCVCGVSITPQ